jgi:quercetin dioxygenase-like cupin family protein
MATHVLPEGGVQLGAGEGQPYWLLTDLLTFKVTGQDTKGAFTIHEVVAGPAIGAPPHVHQHADEAFYILEGMYDFSLAGRAFSAGAGSFVYLPKGVIHTHQAGGGKSARALVVQSPAGVEAFVMEAGTAATDPFVRPGVPAQEDLVKVVGIAKKYGIDVPTA